MGRARELGQIQLYVGNGVLIIGLWVLAPEREIPFKLRRISCDCRWHAGFKLQLLRDKRAHLGKALRQESREISGVPFGSLFACALLIESADDRR